MNYLERVQFAVKQRFEAMEGSHDYQHILRVYNMAQHLSRCEGGDMEVVQLTALLHDISDHKFNGGFLNQNAFHAEEIMKSCSVPDELIKQVVQLVDLISFKGAAVPDEAGPLNYHIVQDADRLDAIGAIGIARAFAFGGSKGRPLYDPDQAPTLHHTFEAYSTSKSHTINHFYEKLLLIYDRLHTTEAKRIGKERHDVMLGFLNQFKNEWDFITHHEDFNLRN
jgi:uncharacterized protein